MLLVPLTIELLNCHKKLLFNRIVIAILGRGGALQGNIQLLWALRAAWISGSKFIEWHLWLVMWYIIFSIAGFVG